MTGVLCIWTCIWCHFLCFSSYLSLNLHFYFKKLSYQRARVICDWSSLESNLFLLGAKTSCTANTNSSSGELYLAPIHISGSSFQSICRYMIWFFCNSVKINSIHATESKDDKISPKVFNRQTSKVWYIYSVSSCFAHIYWRLGEIWWRWS